MAEPRAGMTVGELVDLLASYDRSLLVVMELPTMEYLALARINPPCGDEDEAQRGVCLVGGEYV